MEDALVSGPGGDAGAKEGVRNADAALPRARAAVVDAALPDGVRGGTQCRLMMCSEFLPLEGLFVPVGFVAFVTA